MSEYIRITAHEYKALVATAESVDALAGADPEDDGLAIEARAAIKAIKAINKRNSGKQDKGN